MSFDISLLKLSNFYDVEGSPELDVPLSLALVGFLVILILLIYIDGSVIATLTATLRPDPEAQARISRTRFRGLSIFMLHRLLKVFLVSRFSVKGANLMGSFLLNLLAELLLSNLKVANVHAILDPNSSTPLHRRFFSYSTWSRTFPAVLLYSIVSSTCFYLPARVIHLSDDWGRRFDLSQDMQFGAIFSIIAILYFGAVVPTYAIFIRVAAYTFPPGNYTQERGYTREKNDRPIGIKSAWNSLPWSNLLSFYRSLASVFVIEFSVTVVLFMLTLAHFPVYNQDHVAQFFVKYLG